MKAKLITFLVGFIGMSVLYGLLLSFFKEEFSTNQIIFQSLLFGFFWGLAEVFIFPWIRKKFGKQN